jgi:hypothetical protein
LAAGLPAALLGEQLPGELEPHLGEGRVLRLLVFLDEDHVETEVGSHRLRQGSGRQGEGRRLEGRHHLAALEGAEVAALLGRDRVLGDGRGLLGEVGAGHQLLVNLVDPRSHQRLVLRRRVRRHAQQDVTRSDLLGRVEAIPGLVVACPDRLLVLAEVGRHIGVCDLLGPIPLEHDEGEGDLLHPLAHELTGLTRRDLGGVVEDAQHLVGLHAHALVDHEVLLIAEFVLGPVLELLPVEASVFGDTVRPSFSASSANTARSIRSWAAPMSRASLNRFAS